MDRMKLEGAIDGAMAPEKPPEVPGVAPESKKPMVGPDGKPGGPAKPGVYGADGDPYAYRLNDDGSVTILQGPTGQGHTLSKGVAYDAILGQIVSGQLALAGPSTLPPKPDKVDDRTAFQPPSTGAAGSQLGRMALGALDDSRQG